MNCRIVIPLLTPYLDQRLTGQQMLAVECHLAQCADCAEELESIQQAKSLLRSLVHKSPEVEMEIRLLQVMQQGPDLGPRSWNQPEVPYRRGQRLAKALAFSMFVVLVVAAPFAPQSGDTAFHSASLQTFSHLFVSETKPGFPSHDSLLMSRFPVSSDVSLPPSQNSFGIPSSQLTNFRSIQPVRSDNVQFASYAAAAGWQDEPLGGDAVQGYVYGDTSLARTGRH